MTSGGHGLISVRDACLKEAIGLIEIFGMTGDGENRNRSGRHRFLQRAAELEAVHAGHGKIGQHRVRAKIARLLERLVAVVGVDGAKAVVLQACVQHAGTRSSSTISTSGLSSLRLVAARW